MNKKSMKRDRLLTSMRNYENSRGQKIDLTQTTIGDVFMIILSKLLKGDPKKGRIISCIVLLFSVVCVFFTIWNVKLSVSPNTYAVPGDLINISDLTNLEDSSSVKGLSVRHLEVDSLLKQFYFWVEFREQREFIEKVNPLDGVITSSDVSLGNDSYDMQMSAYLAVNKLVGHEKKSSADIMVTAIPTPLGEPKLLPGDIIKEVDGVKPDSSTDIMQMQVNPIIRDVTVARGNSEVHLKSDLNGITVRRQLYLTNNADYADFYAFAKIDKPHYSGTSAGSSLALEYYNFSVKDIVKGRKIASTGTISTEGKVGSISGVRQKTLLAIDNGIDIMFVPKDNKDEKNYSDALEVVRGKGSDLVVIPVDSLSDMVSYLKDN